jgi:hypothetical protein
MSDHITADDLRAILRERCNAAGGQKNWGAANDVSPQFVSDVLLGKRNVTTSIAALLGYDKKVTYAPCNPQCGGA